MMDDPSGGWEAAADRFMALRSAAGTGIVRAWAKRYLAPSATLLDVGCGSGVPIAHGLIGDGFQVAGIDASPSLVAAFRRNCPNMPVACEPVQNSLFFGRTFAGILTIGLLFLLTPKDQEDLLSKIADILEPGGRFLFSAPLEKCHWRDTLTGRISRSLGADAYRRHLAKSGLHVIDCHIDEGGNHFFDAARPL